MGRLLAILLALILVPSVSMASFAVRCGDGVIRKSCCCKKNQAASESCPTPEFERPCCERVEFNHAGVSAWDPLRGSLFDAALRPASAWELAAVRPRPSHHVPLLSASKPPTGPPVYLALRMLLI